MVRTVFDRNVFSNDRLIHLEPKRERFYLTLTIFMNFHDFYKTEICMSFLKFVNYS